jgi:GntR family transcriptional regulator, transcriptional repressor for pyruvate dehydrogenase complex
MTAKQSGHGWNSVRSETLSGRIIGQIKAALFQDRIRPGERLGGEAALAEQFGVSRMAMRDALRALEATGVIEMRMGPRGGAYIAAGNPDHIAEALAIQFKLVGIDERAVLEAQAVVEVAATGIATLRASEEALAALEEKLVELENSESDLAAFNLRAIEFHEAVVSASGNAAFVTLFQSLSQILGPLYARSTTPKAAKEAVAHHRRLLDFMRARDDAGARMCMAERVHLVIAPLPRA